jgi:hypothetical protein
MPRSVIAQKIRRAREPVPVVANETGAQSVKTTRPPRKKKNAA